MKDRLPATILALALAFAFVLSASHAHPPVAGSGDLSVLAFPARDAGTECLACSLSRTIPTPPDHAPKVQPTEADRGTVGIADEDTTLSTHRRTYAGRAPPGRS